MYTTTDITKHLGIKRERLKIWMTNGYIRPTETASGPGTKNLFSITDLYLLKLFTSLVERGFPRQVAAEKIQLIDTGYKPERISHLALIGFFRHDNPNESKGYPLSFDSDSAEDFVKDSKFLIEEFFNSECDDILIFNFKKIRESVDKALGK